MFGVCSSAGNDWFFECADVGEVGGVGDVAPVVLKAAQPCKHGGTLDLKADQLRHGTINGLDVIDLITMNYQ